MSTRKKSVAGNAGSFLSWKANISVKKNLAVVSGLPEAISLVSWEENQMAALMGAQTAVEAINKWSGGVITSFPGGVVASGSKVGSNS